MFGKSKTIWWPLPDVETKQAIAATSAGAEVSQTAYSELVDCARLRDIRMVNSTFSMSPEALGSNQPDWRLGYDCELTQASYDAEDKLLTGWVSAAASCKAGRKKVFELKARYLIVYLIEGEPDEAVAMKFIERLGAGSAYPYFRAHFAEVASQAGMNAPPLPILRGSKHRLLGEDRASR